MLLSGPPLWRSRIKLYRWSECQSEVIASNAVMWCTWMYRNDGKQFESEKNDSVDYSENIYRIIHVLV